MHSIEQLARLTEESLQSMDMPQTPAGLYDPARYILEAGGKRIRPLLTLLGAQVFSDEIEPVIPIALAMEVFHNFTLVHDDIMDAAPTRRGRPTVHIKWNVTTGILSGDVLLIQAYHLLSKAPAQTLPALLNMFNTTAREVCEGQQEDMDFEQREAVSVADYIQMIANKTSVLLGCCLYCGAIAAGATEQDAQLLYEAGLKLGISFQIQDDILDAWGDAQQFGKQPGGDIIQNKKTILTLTAMALADENDLATLTHAYNTPTTDAATKVAEVLRLYAKYDVRAIAEQQMAMYYEEARVALHMVSASPERKQPLAEMMAMVFGRNK